MSVHEAQRAQLRHGAAAGATGLLLLGGFDLTSDGGSIPVSSGAQRVLAFLALQDRPLGRPYVAGTIWGETTDKRASGSLRSALWNLRLSGHDLVEAAHGCLQLRRGILVDYRRAVAMARVVFDRSRPCPVDVVDGRYFHDDLLRDWYDDWVLIERERFRQFRLHVLEALCERFTDEGRYAHAIDAGIAAVIGEPLRESAQRVLIRAYLAEGNRQEALRQYHSYQILLHEELAVSPSPPLQELMGL
jgi:DNA-binding SARP family transcriptional activator